jgi:hypothetical protein
LQRPRELGFHGRIRLSGSSRGQPFHVEGPGQRDLADGARACEPHAVVGVVQGGDEVRQGDALGSAAQ